MHPVLEVPEILCLIFKCGISEHDLFNCARVCRVWGIWAVDVLWRTCPVPLRRLLRVLAPLPKRSRAYDLGIFPVFDIGNIEEHGWRRFLALCSKISRIKIDCAAGRASLEQIQLAKQTFNGEPFGHLTSLKMAVDDGDHEAIRLLAVPSLTSVYLRCKTFGLDSMDWVNNDLPGVAPNITRFGFRSSSAYLDVSQYSTLKFIELRVDSIGPHLWESLASCRLLTKVLLTHCTSVGKWGEEWRVDYVDFPALCTFNMRSVSTPELLLRSRMPMLQRVVWDSTIRSGSQAMKHLIVPHLEAFSPKLDVDALYDPSNVVDVDDWFDDSDDDCW